MRWSVRRVKSGIAWSAKSFLALNSLSAKPGSHWIGYSERALLTRIRPSARATQSLLFRGLRRWAMHANHAKTIRRSNVIKTVPGPASRLQPSFERSVAGRPKPPTAATRQR